MAKYEDRGGLSSRNAGQHRSSQSASVIVGKSTDGQVFSKAYGSRGRVTVMDRETFNRGSGKADRILAERADRWRKP